jgi:hypothetical protein
MGRRSSNSYEQESGINPLYIIIGVLLIGTMIGLTVYFVNKQNDNNDNNNDNNNDSNGGEGGKGYVCTPIIRSNISNNFLRKGAMGPIPIEMNKRKVESIRNTLSQISGRLQYLRLTSSRPPVPGSTGPVTFPLTRSEEPDGNFVVAMLITIGIYDSGSGNRITLHSILDTGSFELTVVGEGCTSSYCGSTYGVWPSNAPGKIPNTCISSTYGSGTFIGEGWKAPFITKGDNSVNVEFQVTESVFNVSGLQEWPSIMGILPANMPSTGITNFTDSLFNEMKGIEKGYTLSFQGKGKDSITFGQIDRTGKEVNIQPYRGGIIYIYVNIVKAVFTPDRGSNETLSITSAILDTGTTGLNFSGGSAYTNRSGTYTFTLENGVVLSGRPPSYAVDDGEFGLNIIGIFSMLGKTLGVDWEKNKIYIK